MTLLSLLACAALLVTIPPPAEVSDPWAGEPACAPGPWRIECPACEPPLAVVGLAVCAERDAMTEALGALPGGFAAWRESNPGADLRVGEDEP